jgi:hypothetical protein
LNHVKALRFGFEIEPPQTRGLDAASNGFASELGKDYFFDVLCTGHGSKWIERFAVLSQSLREAREHVLAVRDSIEEPEIRDGYVEAFADTRDTRWRSRKNGLLSSRVIRVHPASLGLGGSGAY